MRTIRGSVAASLAAVVALAWCGQVDAQASTDDEARAQFDTGVELFEQGKFEQAAVAFARAYELKPTYKLRYNIGQVENELGHYAKALDAYTLYLAEGGAEIERSRQDQVTAEIARLRTLVGMIEIAGAPKGATIFVDDRRSGTTPLPGPLFVDLGEHSVVVKQGAAELHREVVNVAGGQRVALKVESATAGGAPAAAAEPVAEGGAAEGQGPVADETKPRRVWTWVATGIAGAAAIGGGIAGGIALKRESDLRDACDGEQCDPDLRDDEDAMRVASVAADVMFGVAGAAAVAAIVLFFVEPDEEVRVAPVVALAPSPGGAFAGVQGRF